MKHLTQSPMGMVAALAVVVGVTVAYTGGERASAPTKDAATAFEVTNADVSNATTTTQHVLNSVLGKGPVPVWSPALGSLPWEMPWVSPTPPGFTCTATGCDTDPSVCWAIGQTCTSGCIQNACYYAW